MSRKHAVPLGLAVAACAAIPQAHAAENAAGFYLLGSKGSMAGYVPPPGTYVSDLTYLYAGDASGNAAVGIALRRLGNVRVDIDVDIALDGDAAINAPIATWIAPGKVAGGNVGFGVMVPWGYKNVEIGIDTLATITLPNRTIVGPGRHFEIEDSSTKLGDPVLTSLIGWHAGSWHWSLAALLNVPIGPWDSDSISNIAFNRWALDTSAAVT